MSRNSISRTLLGMLPSSRRWLNGHLLMAEGGRYPCRGGVANAADRGVVLRDGGGVAKNDGLGSFTMPIYTTYVLYVISNCANEKRHPILQLYCSSDKSEGVRRFISLVNPAVLLGDVQISSRAWS